MKERKQAAPYETEDEGARKEANEEDESVDDGANEDQEQPRLSFSHTQERELIAPLLLAEDGRVGTSDEEEGAQGAPYDDGNEGAQGAPDEAPGKDDGVFSYDDGNEGTQGAPDEAPGKDDGVFFLSHTTVQPV
jgi:hypothetical protein